LTATQHLSKKKKETKALERIARRSMRVMLVCTTILLIKRRHLKYL